MATSISSQSNTVLYVIPTRTTRPTIPFLRPTQFGNFPNRKPSLRTSLNVARFGLGLGLGLGNLPPLPDPETTERIARELFGRAEGLFYTIADAAVTASASADSVASSKQSNDWLSGITSYMETVLKVLKNGLSTVHTPYSYGFAIILLTVLVKAATFPLSKKQVESAMAMRSFQPQIKAIQQRYAGDQERIQLETARLYKLAGINPLAGCLPTLATIPVWIGLYRALSNVADEGLLTEGFFWIPSLAGPTTIAARQSGGGISWLFPFVDGQPPLGWPDTLAYLVLPVLLVISQYVSVQIMQSTQPQSDDPNVKTSQAITKFLPLMIGYFSLSVPSGLSLYWLTNNILSTAQQVWLQKMGGANNPVKKLSNDSTDNREQTETLKSVFEVTPVAEPPKKEKPAAVGPQPGDRFRQLKELEARKKLQKEEEQRKTAAAASQDISKSVFEVTPVAEAPTKEKPTAVGPQPGDRFRQLKELEARKRQQREEEQRKTAAADSQDISKSVFEVTTVAEAPKIENPTAVGLQPGDRFRQLKELEARKRQQIEEEQRKTAAAASQDISVTNVEVKKESNSDGSFLNGESPSAESTQDERQYLHENLKKEKAVSTIGATVNKVSMVDEHQR